MAGLALTGVVNGDVSIRHRCTANRLAFLHRGDEYTDRKLGAFEAQEPCKVELVNIY